MQLPVPGGGSQVPDLRFPVLVATVTQTAAQMLPVTEPTTWLSAWDTPEMPVVRMEPMVWMMVVMASIMKCLL